MAFQKDLSKYLNAEELEKLSPNLQDYIRTMFGLEGISPETEKELWERLTPEEQKRATEITKRLIIFKNTEEKNGR